MSSDDLARAITQRLNGRRLGVFVFDMDGVVFEGRSFWLDLHIALGTKDAALDLASRYLHSDYTRLAEITARTLWKGMSAEPLHKLVQERTYVPGICRLLGVLHDADVMTCIVTSGPHELAQRAQRECAVHTIFANRVDVADGRFTGELDLGVDNNRKGDLLARFLPSLGPDRRVVAVMGDTASDTDMYRYADLRIAYDADCEIQRAAADICLGTGEIPSLTAALAQYFTSFPTNPVR